MNKKQLKSIPKNKIIASLKSEGFALSQNSILTHSLTTPLLQIARIEGIRFENEPELWWVYRSLTPFYVYQTSTWIRNYPHRLIPFFSEKDITPFLLSKFLSEREAAAEALKTKTFSIKDFL